MITPTEFVRQWNEPLSRLEPLFAQGQQKDLPQETLAFLTEAGLPLECAPYLSFNVSEGLKYVHDVYNLRDEFLTPQEKSRLALFSMIGSDGEDNPICLDASHPGRVIILDHSDNFKLYQFVNNSVPQLAESLLIYRDFMKAYNESSEEAWNQNVPEHARQELTTQLKQIDPNALNPDCFWFCEINDLGLRI